MSERPVIIIKKKSGHGGHHGGAWKVAYADFVTAMMALFIVLWLMNSSKQVQEAVGGYFRDPTGESRKVGTDMSGSGENFVLTPDNMEDLKQQLQHAIREVPNFDLLKDQISMTVTKDGLRIELMENATGTFFSSGNAELSPASHEILSTLSAELSKLENEIYMEGHTDSKPYAEDSTYTNWELSVDRANSARRYMQSHGLRTDQVGQVRGYADRQLLKSEDPQDPTNRRISVIVRFLEKPPGSTPPEASGATEATHSVEPQASAHAESPAAKTAPVASAPHH